MGLQIASFENAMSRPHPLCSAALTLIVALTLIAALTLIVRAGPEREQVLDPIRVGACFALD